MTISESAQHERIQHITDFQHTHTHKHIYKRSTFSVFVLPYLLVRFAAYYLSSLLIFPCFSQCVLYAYYCCTLQWISFHFFPHIFFFCISILPTWPEIILRHNHLSAHSTNKWNTVNGNKMHRDKKKHMLKCACSFVFTKEMALMLLLRGKFPRF